MNKSFTYYLTIFVIQLKGIKNIFSKSPIDYLKLRKIDVYSPNSKFYKTNKISTFQILKTAITQIENSEKSDKLLIYLHGGAFISGPAQHHWDSMEIISKKTNFNIWMCNYPKAPENKIEVISINIDQIYQTALSKYQSENIILMGDSAGGTLVIALTQRLILNKEKLPSKLILISPVIDATFKNEDIMAIDKKDVMLSQIGVSSAIRMCSEHSNDVRISPINGKFNFFPKTYLYIAEHDITFPDQLIFSSKLNLENIDNEIYIGKEMPHIWPLLPVMKEAKTALHQIINNINA
jgi:acetyl esterase/lipase